MSVLICIAEKEGLNISDLILVIFYTEKKYFLATFSRIEMVIFLFRIITKSMDEKYIATPKTTQRKLYN